MGDAAEADLVVGAAVAVTTIRGMVMAMVVTTATLRTLVEASMEMEATLKTSVQVASRVCFGNSSARAQAQSVMNTSGKQISLVLEQAEEKQAQQLLTSVLSPGAEATVAGTSTPF